MTLLYILGSGSRFNNNELRYSLRTLHRHLPGHDVIVAGENPGFLSKKVNYIPVPESDGNKEYRIASKIFRTIKKAKLTEPFLFLNDDFFFTGSFDPANYPYYYKGCLSERSGSGDYVESLKATHDYFQSKKLSTHHFDVHTPIVYDPLKFLDLKQVWDYSKTLPFGLVVKSTYCNQYQVSGELYEDAKLNMLEDYTDFERIFSTNVFSCSDMGWMRGVEDYLELKYPEPSIYEK